MCGFEKHALLKCFLLTCGVCFKQLMNIADAEDAQTSRTDEETLKHSVHQRNCFNIIFDLLCVLSPSLRMSIQI